MLKWLEWRAPMSDLSSNFLKILVLVVPIIFLWELFKMYRKTTLEYFKKRRWFKDIDDYLDELDKLENTSDDQLPSPRELKEITNISNLKRKILLEEWSISCQTTGIQVPFIEFLLQKIRDKNHA